MGSKAASAAACPFSVCILMGNNVLLELNRLLSMRFIAWYAASVAAVLA